MCEIILCEMISFLEHDFQQLERFSFKLQARMGAISKATKRANSEAIYKSDGVFKFGGGTEMHRRKR